jgi:malate permease and related proteins
VLLWTVFSQVCLPIFVLVGIGWLLDRRFSLDLGTLVKLNIYLLVPAFIFVQVVGSTLAAGVAVRVMAFTFCIIMSMGVLSLLVGRICRYPAAQTRSLQLATMFYNSGNYGIPLMLLAYPANGPVLQVFIVLTQNVSTFTVGLWLAASAHRTGWRSLLPTLRQVSIWAVIGAVVVRTLHIPVMEWRWLWVPLSYLAEAVVGFALVTLGAQLSKTEHTRMWRRLSWALGLRLLAGPALACALVPLFGFKGEAASVMVLSSSFPTAVNTALIAHEFKADSHFAAAAVFYSTLLSMVTVTVLVTVLRLYAQS